MGVVTFFLYLTIFHRLHKRISLDIVSQYGKYDTNSHSAHLKLESFERFTIFPSLRKLKSRMHEHKELKVLWKCRPYFTEGENSCLKIPALITGFSQTQSFSFEFSIIYAGEVKALGGHLPLGSTTGGEKKSGWGMKQVEFERGVRKMGGASRAWNISWNLPSHFMYPSLHTPPHTKLTPSPPTGLEGILRISWIHTSEHPF